VHIVEVKVVQLVLYQGDLIQQAAVEVLNKSNGLIACTLRYLKSLFGNKSCTLEKLVRTNSWLQSIHTPTP
jgi:hypothetical protein